MVINPEQLRAKVVAQSKSQIEALCLKIDELLNKSAFMNGTENISVSVDIASIPRFIVDQVIKLYSQAGWDTKLNYDQRDGDYLNVSTRKQVSNFGNSSYWRD